ncbi:nitrilase-related carbon-nitrogen hydrolase, partial [Vibrio parahaemolyticus]
MKMLIGNSAECSLRPFRAAVAQMEPVFGDRAANRQRLCSRITDAARGGAELVVFPECALSGYVFDSAEEARP